MCFPTSHIIARPTVEADFEDAEFREAMLIERPGPQDNLTVGDFTYTPSARRALVRHKLRLILMSRRYFFQFGSREAARRVTQELFDLAFSPGELDMLR